MNARRVVTVTLCIANALAGFSLWSNWTFGSIDLAKSGRANPVSWGDRPTLLIAADPQTVDVNSLVRVVRRDGEVPNLTVAIVVPDDAPVESFGADVVLQAQKLPVTSRALAETWNTFALFDAGGDLIEQGPLDGAGLSGVLQVRLAGKPELNERAALLLQKAFEDGLLDGVTVPDSGSQTLLLLSTVGTACGTGEVLRQARALSEKRAMPIAVMVPNSWSSGQISALQDAFALGETPSRVHAELERRWRDLERTFGENRTAGLLVVLGTDGVKTVFTDRLGILDGLKGTD